jgi:hypothetical protein
VITQVPSANSTRIELIAPRAVTAHGSPNRSGSRVRTRHT